MSIWQIKNLTHLWCAFILLIGSSLFNISSAEPLTITETDASVKLGPHYQLLLDPTHTITINDILADTSQLQFSPLPNDKFNLGYRPETYWFKVDLYNPSQYDLAQLLEFSFPLLDQINVYVINNSSRQILARYQGGDHLPFNARSYKHPNFIFPITLPAQSDVGLYFRIRSDGSMTAGATLWQPDVFPSKHRLEYFSINLYMGLLLALISYNFLLFVSLREISYFYYVLFASSMFLAIGSFNGLWYELFWPNSPRWHDMSIPVGFALAGIFASLFSQTFLQTKSQAPFLDKLFRFVTIAFALTILAYPFVSLIYLAPVISICAVALAFTSISVGIRLSFKGNRLAFIYLIAWISLLLGITLLSVRNFGFVPSNLLTRYGIVFGSALEMVLLSFALAQRISFLRHENEKSRQEAFQSHTQLIEVLRNSEHELMRRVKKRTYALATANKKLREQEEGLKQLAHYDPLTGLANRTLIIEQLELLLQRAKREKAKLAVLFLDLDNFKPVNDSYGHQVGDELLIAIADKLRYILRDSDVVGRLGGDEFIVLLESGDGELNAEEVIEKIKTTIAQPVTIDELSVEVGVSIGLAYYPDNGQTADQLISTSDNNMYIDKKKKP